MTRTTNASRQRIGFDRFIRRAWLDQAALLAHELRDGAALRAALLNHLAGAVSGEEARRKTVYVLTRIWWRVPEAHVPLRDEALAQVAHLGSEDRLVLHWGMTLLAYPLFCDVVTIVGRLLRLQSTFKVVQLSRRIGAEWGNRTTLEYAIPRMVRSLVDWDVLRSTPEAGETHSVGRTRSVGCYQAGLPVAPSDPEIVVWLLEAVLRTHAANMLVSDLLRSPELFPFAISLSSGDLLRSERFRFHQQGQNMLMIQPAAEG